MSNTKVECNCCGKMMVPKVVYGHRFFSLAASADHSVCPFCLSPYWMVSAEVAELRSRVAQRVVLRGWLFGMGLLASVVAVSVAGWMSIAPVAVVWAVVLLNLKSKAKDNLG